VASQVAVSAHATDTETSTGRAKATSGRPGRSPKIEVGASRGARLTLRTIALVYLLMLLALPLGLILYRTFEGGLSPVLDALKQPDALHALKVTLEVAISAVILNTVFGVGVSLLLVRHKFKGRRLLDALIDLPVAVSPVVVGLALILVYGRFSSVGGWLDRQGITIIFSLPGMVLATVFVSLPLVVRSIAPVLQELGDEMEQAAKTLGATTLQTFKRITLPSISSALGYGVVLCLARAVGEYGAVAVVSGRLVGQTQTLPLYVQERFENYDQTSAFAVATLLAVIAGVALLLSKLLRPKESR
jgi:sulfate/thiosulfate transport system permease protein